MHIPDGFVPPQLCIIGYGASGLIIWQCLRQIKRQGDPSTQLPKASLMVAAFFVISSIQIPLPPMSLHLILSGLLGAVLGYYAFLAIVIGLFFQALFLGHGGFSTLGINAIIIGVPALVGYVLFQLRHWLPGKPPLRYGVSGFLAGSVGMALSVTLFISALIFTVPVGFDVVTERTALLALGIAHGPLILVEGIFTALLVTFLHRTKPELLENLARPSHSPSGEQLCD